MEKKIKSLFDYQRFKADPKLAEMIAETESRYRQELGDDEISVVSAAGDPLAILAENKADDDKPT